MLEMNRPSSISSIGHAMLIGVFCAVAIMFGARWFVAWDYNSISVGDSVTARWGGPAGNQNEVTKIENGIVTIRDAAGKVYTAPIEEVTEL